jgi:hypothetical protein
VEEASDERHAVRAELAALLLADPRQLGQVYRQIEGGASTPKDIVAAGAAANTGAVSNLKQVIAALLGHTIPESAVVARQAAGSTRWFLTAELSDPARGYLMALRSELDAKARSAGALARDADTVMQTDRALAQRAEDLSGVYVYSFLHYLQHPLDPETGRCWLKIGSTTKGVWKRVVDQARQTSMPEDPRLLRIYHSATLGPADIEERFHRVLDDAGIERSAARHSKAGIEWFAATVERLEI